MRRQRAYVLTIAIAGTVGLLIAGCGSSTPSSSSATHYTLGDVELYANPVGTAFAQGVAAEAKAKGISASFADPNDDAQVEAADVASFVSKKVSILLYDPSDPNASIVNVQKADRAGIPVICFDTCVNNPQKLVKAFATSDNYQLGLAAGQPIAQYISQKLGGTARVGLLTCQSIAICVLRRDGLNKSLSSVHLDIEASQEAYVADTATSAAESMLIAHPDLQVIICENEGALIGAAAAVKSRGLAGKVVVFGIDMDPQIAQLLLAPDNIVQATVGQDAFDIGETAVKMAWEVLHRQKVTPFEQQIPGIEYSRTDPAKVRSYEAANGGS